MRLPPAEADKRLRPPFLWLQIHSPTLAPTSAAPGPSGLGVLGWLRLGQDGGMPSCHFGLPGAGGVCSALHPPAAQIHTRHHPAMFIVLQDRQSPSVSHCPKDRHGHDLPEGPSL